jgi:serine/threonine-protein kinase
MPRTRQLRSYPPPAPSVGGFAIDRQLRTQPGVSTLFAVGDSDGEGTVALQLLPFLAGRPDSHRPFLGAAGIRERLGCDGLVPTIAAGHAPEGSWIVLDLPDAPTLRQILSMEGPLSLERSLAILRPVAEALDAGHAQGLVCDSLTADAIHVVGGPGLDERGQLIELGPAWPASVRPGRMLGDPTGLAPEEIRGEPPSPASNVYALGALLVGCLTAAPPFWAPTRAGMLSCHLSAPPPRLSDQLAGVPPGLDDVIASALAKDPRERPASAGELIELVARAAAEPPGRGARRVESIAEPVEVVPPALETASAAADPPAVARVRTPNPKAMRVMSRVAIVVPAISLTLLAVIAVLHADPVQRGPATSSAQPASGRQAVKSARAETAPLVPVQTAGAGPRPSGHVELTAEDGRRLLTVSAAHLPPERAEPRQAYAVWLFNSRQDAARLGFVVPPVGTGGRFESHRDLPAQAARYREIVVTLEDAAEPLPQGPIFLRAALPALTERSSGSLAR